ncbi:hypothetical protein N9164_14320, partial [Draconibacterium sp.]|nr:hypothetical protein [Draconibacterium sp.]
DATEAGRKVYQKFGFVDEYRISRMVNNSSDYSNTFDIKSALEIDKRDVVEIVEFDGRVFGVPREQLIKAWYLDRPQGSYMIKQNDQIKGFALGRNGNRFLQIGPVSANSMSDTKILMSHALLNHTGKPVVVDVMNDKTDFVHWLTALGFEKKREFTRMFLKSNLNPGEKHKQYLIGGPEFG